MQKNASLATDIFFPSPYRKWFLYGLLVFVITAWFSVGYHHPDEHFQVLEFANYKLGFSPASNLPWEFFAQCRSALQPFIVYCLVNLLEMIGFNNPFIVAFILRLSMGVLTWWLNCRLVILFLPTLRTEKSKSIFIGCSFFLWFVPYISVRFSAENLAGLLFFLAVSMIIKIDEYAFQNKTIRLILVGLLLGFSIYLRLQMAFALIGLGIWILFLQKSNWKNLISIFIGGSLAILLSIYVDYWFYGNWVFTPFNYFKVNIIDHKAKEFGVSAWWYYFPMFLETAVLPIAIGLLLSFLLGIWKKPTHIYSLICATFLIGHFFIGHKEIRFLFPIIYGFIFLVCVGIDKLLQEGTHKKIVSWAFSVLAGINLVLLVFRIFAPAQEAMKYYDFFYNYSQNQETTLITFERSPYYLVGLEANFYKNKKMDIQIIQNTDQLSSILKNGYGKSHLFYTPGLTADIKFASFKMRTIYCILPGWILHFDVNHWQERANIGVVYQIDSP